MKPNENFDIAFTGDLILGDWHFTHGFGMNKALRKEGAEYFLEYIEPLLSQAGIVVGNLEGPLAPRKKARSKSMLGDERFLPALKKAGFRVISLANNHLMEYGTERARYTIEKLNDAGFIVAGLAESPNQVIDFNGSTIEIITADILPEHHQRRPYPSKPLMFSGPLDEMGGEICRIIGISQADYKIIYLHWGEEFIPFPDLKQMKWGRTFIDSGADAVIGSHPHVPQTVEEYKSKVIAYSLGNFLSDMAFPPTREGFILGLKLTDKNNIEYKILPYRVDSAFRPVPLGREESNAFRNRLHKHIEFESDESAFKAKMRRYTEVARMTETEYWEWVKGFYKHNFWKYPLKAHWGWLKEKLRIF